MCEVQPQHVSMLLTFGACLFVGGLVSLGTGATYFRRVIRRDEEPRAYWSSTFSLLFLGVLVLGGVAVC
jgi:drug/metabolite transporter (DMT)-like permease